MRYDGGTEGYVYGEGCGNIQGTRGDVANCSGCAKGVGSKGLCLAQSLTRVEGSHVAVTGIANSGNVVVIYVYV